jgi:uncharacterized protein YcnI
MNIQRRSLQLLILASAFASLAPAVAFAHAVVYPKKSATGAYERYVLRVPNEKTVATTRVEIHFPDGVRITAFEDVPGWQLQVLTDSAKRIVGAVWTGALAPQRFVEFPFMAANPKTATQLIWPAYQTYAGNEVVDWTGEQGSKTPASVTSIAPVDSTGATASVVSGQWVQWIALIVALVSLGLVLRPKDRVS